MFPISIRFRGTAQKHSFTALPHPTPEVRGATDVQHAGHPPHACALADAGVGYPGHGPDHRVTEDFARWAKRAGAFSGIQWRLYTPLLISCCINVECEPLLVVWHSRCMRRAHQNSYLGEWMHSPQMVQRYPGTGALRAASGGART